MKTTTLILFICALFSLAWSFIYFAYRCRIDTAPETGHPASTQIEALRGAIIPSLVLGPLILVLGFRLFEVNFLFPLFFDATLLDLVSKAVVPAAILFLASGLSLSLRQAIRAETCFWSQKAFVTAAESYGTSRAQALRRLVLTKALTRAWSQSLPWIFSELIIIEAIFAAPGIANHAWELAKIRQFEALAATILQLSALYLVCWALSIVANRWIGQKLHSYA